MTTAPDPFVRLLRAAAARYGVTPSDICGPRRPRPLARARQIVMFLAARDLQLSTVDIGRRLGGRDHSTVIHGRDVIERLSQSNSVMRDRVARVRREAGI